VGSFSKSFREVILMADKMTLKEATKKLAIQANNGIWSTLDKKKPPKEEMEIALRMAFTSTHLWSKAGTLVNQVRGEYMISRVYSKMKLGDEALRHAQRCLKLARKAKKEDAKNFKDWDMPFVYEVLARAHGVAGNKAECKTWKDKAQKLINKIADDQDKQICQGELDNFKC
jgi:hypothetical protein